MNTLAEAMAYQFADFLLDLRAGVLFRVEADGTRTPLTLGSRAFRMLCVLTERRGAFVSKRAMMDAVWPDVVVEENNLTVQMSALRRVLDHGRETSCIQTVPGRGYRLLPQVVDSSRVMTDTDTHGPASYEDAASGSLTGPEIHGRRWRMSVSWRAALSVCAAALMTGIIGLGYQVWPTASERPALSVVLPFRNLSGDLGGNYLTAGVTQDLTGDLAQVPGAFAIDGYTERVSGHGLEDVRQAGLDLAGHDPKEGSKNRLGATPAANADLVSAETGAPQPVTFTCPQAGTVEVRPLGKIRHAGPSASDPDVCNWKDYWGKPRASLFNLYPVNDTDKAAVHKALSALLSGRTTGVSYDFTAGTGNLRHVTWTFLRHETLTVGAKTFDTIVFDEKSEDANHRWGGDYVWWFDPKNGLWLKCQFRLLFGAFQNVAYANYQDLSVGTNETP
jgi:DNA-binding winged helix-turn-helix (wHTH) protein/TolB-like protein